MNASDSSDTVVFLVHGVGQRAGKFAGNVQQLKNNTEEILAQLSASDLTSRRVHYIPIEWHVKLHARATVDHRIRNITLPTIPLMRVINNDFLSDIIYYCTKIHGQVIRDIVIEEINNCYQKWIKENPGVSCNYMIMGHSLGGIICYDLLCMQRWMFDGDNGKCNESGYEALPETLQIKLDFRPRALVIMGSPLSALMIMRGQAYESFQLPKAIQFYNVFHPLDPLAYRFESLADPSYCDIEPIKLEHWNGKSFEMYYNDIVSSLVPDFSQVKMPQMPSYQNGELIFSSAKQMVMRHFSSVIEYFHWLSGTEETQEVQLNEARNEPPAKKRRTAPTRKSRRRTANEYPDEVSIQQPSSKPSQVHTLTREEVLAEEKKWEDEFKPKNRKQRKRKALSESEQDDQITETFVHNLQQSADLLAEEVHEAAPYQEVLTAQHHESGGTLKKRLDFVLQINSTVNASHEYLAGLPAHFSYWGNKDVALFIINIFSNNKCSQQ